MEMLKRIVVRQAANIRRNVAAEVTRLHPEVRREVRRGEARRRKPVLPGARGLRLPRGARQDASGHDETQTAAEVLLRAIRKDGGAAVARTLVDTSHAGWALRRAHS